MNIIFDLDGTLIDSSYRMYVLFREMIPGCDLSYKEYWDLKRSKHSHQCLIEKRYPDVNYLEFNNKWLSRIESRRLLKLDNNYEDTIEVLTALYGRYPIILFTARQCRANLIWELDMLELSRFFSEIYVTENLVSKGDLLSHIVSKSDNEEYIYVTDMGSDIVNGNSLDCITIAITHGFMDRASLTEYRPRYVIDNLSDLLPLINRRKSMSNRQCVCK